MEQIWLHGDLKDLHFTGLLARIWKSEGSGHLEIIGVGAEKKLDFFKGRIAVPRDSLDNDLFLEFLSAKKALREPFSEKLAAAVREKRFLLRALLDEGHLDPGRLWESMADFQKELLLPVFDWSQAEYFFDPEKSVQEQEILMCISIPDLILEGTRRMTNETLIRSFLPEDNKVIQRQYPDGTGQLTFKPHEEYLLALLESQKTVKNIYAISELGERETQKALFGLLNLGIIGYPEKSKPGFAHLEMSKSEIFRVMEAFNEKCSYIFKYISKEIGPVALNILEKGLDDTKPLLSPLFAKIRLGPDGKIEANSIIKSGISLSGEEIKAQLFRGLNEILVALVLAVKKTLGSEHEAILVKNLKKIGEWN